jgi:hypothetical protein
VNLRLAAAAAFVLSLAAACGESTPSPTASVSSASTQASVPTASLPSLSATPSPSQEQTATCRTVDSLEVGAWTQGKLKGGWIPAITSTGEIVVATAAVPGIFNELNIVNPKSKATTLVISRPPPASAEAAKSAIADVAANAGWVVWNETGFSLGEGDWAIWAMDRRSGLVTKVAANEPGADGRALPGWVANLAVEGDTAIWAAPTPVGAKAESRIYVADLANRSVAKLAADANYPSLLSGNKIAALLATGRSSNGGVLSQPAEFGIVDASVALDAWATPSRFARYVATDQAAVLIEVTRDATADDPSSEAHAVVRLGGNQARTVALPGEWGDVTAGRGFVAFSDDLHLWLLGSSDGTPTTLVETTSTVANIHFVAKGTWLYWHTDAVAGTAAHDSLLQLGCGT